MLVKDLIKILEGYEDFDVVFSLGKLKANNGWCKFMYTNGVE